jgi:hypothetical protein
LHARRIAYVERRSASASPSFSPAIRRRGVRYHPRPRRSGRVAEGGALLRRYGGHFLHRGFESLLLRLHSRPPRRFRPPCPCQERERRPADRYATARAEGWQSGRMRRSRKPLFVLTADRGFKSLPLRSTSRIQAPFRGMRLFRRPFTARGTLRPSPLETARQRVSTVARQPELAGSSPVARVSRTGPTVVHERRNQTCPR